MNQKFGEPLMRSALDSCFSRIASDDNSKNSQNEYIKVYIVFLIQEWLRI